jgi:hypothetical protein
MENAGRAGGGPRAAAGEAALKGWGRCPQTPPCRSLALTGDGVT